MSIARQFGGVRPIAFRGVRRAGDSNGGGGGDVEVRLARLEENVQHIDSAISEIRQDIRGIRAELAEHPRDMVRLRNEMSRMLILAATVAGFMLGGGAYAYVKLSDRIDALAAQTTEQFNRVNDQFDRMNARFDREFTGRFDQMNKRVDEIHVRLDRTNERIDELGTRLEGKIDALSEQISRLPGARRASAEPSRAPDLTR